MSDFVGAILRIALFLVLTLISLFIAGFIFVVAAFLFLFFYLFARLRGNRFDTSAYWNRSASTVRSTTQRFSSKRFQSRRQQDITDTELRDIE